jgi:hypothetical protein
MAPTWYSHGSLAPDLRRRLERDRPRGLRHLRRRPVRLADGRERARADLLVRGQCRVRPSGAEDRRGRYRRRGEAARGRRMEPVDFVRRPGPFYDARPGPGRTSAAGEPDWRSSRSSRRRSTIPGSASSSRTSSPTSCSTRRCPTPTTSHRAGSTRASRRTSPRATTRGPPPRRPGRPTINTHRSTGWSAVPTTGRFALAWPALSASIPNPDLGTPSSS